tara:strand:+ start:574 stop:1299 length:726 start_codon:yes stop_codon:yes gene_type:complete
MIIKEHSNNLPKTTPIKEIMELFIPGVNPSLPNRNGFVYCLIGTPGSGKSSLLFSTLFSKHYYRSKFDNVYLITPESSFLSLSKHPFEGHEKVYHELNEEVLSNITSEIEEFKKDAIRDKNPLEYSCIIVDDFASDLKDKNIIRALKQMLIKSRHINTACIFTLQAYNLFPLLLRKWITNISLFKPKNAMESENIREELLNMNKDDFIKLTKYVYDKPFNHLDLDTMSMELRKNYNLLQID